MKSLIEIIPIHQLYTNDAYAGCAPQDQDPFVAQFENPALDVKATDGKFSTKINSSVVV